MTESKPMTLDERARSCAEVFMRDVFKSGWKECADWFFKHIEMATGEESGDLNVIKKWYEREISE